MCKKKVQFPWSTFIAKYKYVAIMGIKNYISIIGKKNVSMLPLWLRNKAYDYIAKG